MLYFAAFVLSNMYIQENVSLLPFNTFGIDQKARFLAVVKSRDEVTQALVYAKERRWPLFILGGGSNILLRADLEALVLKIEIKGKNLLSETGSDVLVEVGAGENWHEFVLYCIDRGWAGVENLSLIPGTVGASPMQNIGAYGVEIKEVFDHLWAINRETLRLERFDREECHFGYRESVFKNTLKDQYIITEVVFRLSKNPTLHTSYGAIQDILREKGLANPGIRDVSDAVVQIRQSKLPDPKQIGNAGSFFKNPSIPLAQFEALKLRYPEIPGFPKEETVKVPAAWLIEKAGWKGKRFGSVGVHSKQPLVLVNYGGGKGEEIASLSQDIQQSVVGKFGIRLQPEVNFL